MQTKKQLEEKIFPSCFFIAVDIFILNRLLVMIFTLERTMKTYFYNIRSVMQYKTYKIFSIN